MSKKPNYAWDTSVFIAWLNEEEDKPLDDIAIVIEQIEANKANLIVAVTTYSEILETKYTEKQLEAFDKFLNRSNVVVVDTTPPIAKKAGQIRSRALDLDSDNPRKIKVPDATIIATAILFLADVLHSFDEKLRSLSGSEIVDGLEIALPMDLGGQMSVFRS